MVSTVFHIGFPKSGSTYLQRQIFQHLNQYAYMGVHAAEKQSEFRRFLNDFHTHMFKTDGLTFDADRCIHDKQKLAEQHPDKPLLFSYEYAVGVLFGYPDAVVKAQRLQQIFGRDLKIIIVVREQTAILSSQYRDHPFEPRDIQKGHPVSFAQWYRQTDALRYFRFTDLVHYDRLVRVYDDLFGANNVLVLPMELMAENPQLYAQKIGDFLNVPEATIKTLIESPPVNTGKSNRENALRRFRRRFPIPVEFSKILPRPVYQWIRRHIQNGGRERITIPTALEQEIRQRYAQSNAMLAQRTGFNLAELGYSLSSEPADGV